jgi:Putative DNA-binding domain
MRNLALADVTPYDVRAMVEENETLFVEHKSTVDGEGYKIAEAIASFANTLGGWVVVGIRDGEATDWIVPESLTDRVRQILDRWLDPLPAFASRVVNHSGNPLGLVRVYESTDTPHVLRNGKVVVRSVAEVRNQTQVYRPGGVETQLVLRRLAERGRDAINDAKLKLASTPLIAGVIGMTSEWGVPRMAAAHIAVRAVPLVGDRLSDIAVSRAGRALIDEAVRELATSHADAKPTLLPRASGLISELRQSSPLVPGGAEVPRTAVAATDAAGVVAVVLRFHETVSLDPGTTPELSLDQARNAIIWPLLKSAVGVLNGAELFGRSILELRFGELVAIVRPGATRSPSTSPRTFR